MLFRFFNICLDKCKSNYECGEGQKCYYRRCLESDFCLSNKACSAGYVCSNYKCVDKNSIPVPATTTTTTTTPAELPAGCEYYKVLTNPNRKKSYATHQSGQYKCDTSESPYPYDWSKYFASDWQGPGWYRIRPSIGTKIPTSPPKVEHCGTYRSGWISGGSSPGLDQTFDAKVCFVNYGNNCSRSVDVKIRNCRNFMLYYLPTTPTCNLGYCVE